MADRSKVFRGDRLKTIREQKHLTQDIESAYQELAAYETIEAFWQASGGVINQLLHRLLGGRRLTILNGQVTGSIAWK